MQVDALARTVLIDRLLDLEERAAHLSVMADIAANAAWRARQEADQAQRLLSEVKVFIALLPDDSTLELLAPRDADDPAKRLGVRVRHRTARRKERSAPQSKDQPAPSFSDLVAAINPQPRVLRPDREEPSPCPDVHVPANSVTAAPMTIPTFTAAAAGAESS
jgi:hypothetical protein